MNQGYSSIPRALLLFSLLFIWGGCGEEEEETSYLCGGSNYCWEINGDSGDYRTLEECLATGCQDPDNPATIRIDSVCNLIPFTEPELCYRKLRITHLDNDRVPNSRLQSGSLTFFNDMTWESAINPGNGTVRKSGRWLCKSDSLVVEILDGNNKFGNFYFKEGYGYTLSTSVANYTFTFNAYPPFPDCPE